MDGLLHTKQLLNLLSIVYIQQQSELHVYDETPNLVNFVLLSLTELYLHHSCKFHAESTPVMESFY